MGDSTFLVFGFNSIKPEYLNPTMDLGNVPINSALSCIGPTLKALK